ncbi:MAG TPA: SNF2-related protein [Thermoanaerobaculia bacterium]|nr:SNF2-related protein [Thermoanaerobaculia bacterium]
MWKPGDRLTHRLNPGLGPGKVVAVSGRSVEVEFPDAGQTLTLAAGDSALAPLVLQPGTRARLAGSAEIVAVEELGEAGVVRLADGRAVAAEDLWPVPAEPSLLERLARGSVDAFEDFANRLDALRLGRLREARGLGSFLGGRIRLFPHQLYVAERATQAAPVRWLLADEVGLGKTVEACLILNRLVHTGRADRVLVVAPETLTVQWLGELWRKHHQIFVLLDEKRLADVARDHGADFNPFDSHRRVIVGLETLAERRRLTEQAVAAGIDLLVVDEAHHLRRPPGHPGNPAYRAVEPIAALGRNVLLLTATPLEDDAHGFFRLLELLRPEELGEASFEERLARRAPLPPCTSATRRADIGGQPPRVGMPVEIGDPSSWGALLRLEARLRALPVAEGNPLARRRKAEALERALASPAALKAASLPEVAADPEIAALIAAADQSDPRLDWLATAAAGWARAREKTLVFVAHLATLERVKEALEQRALSRVALFHEALSPERRDIEVAQFRLPDGPALLLSTEAGGEGRNFEFCRRLVLFDLPWNPAAVEQRIGRLDRIGRSQPTEIVYFRPSAGLGRTVAGLYEAIGLFREPLGGLVRELRHVARAIADQAIASQIPADQTIASQAPAAQAIAGTGEIDPEAFAPVLAEAEAARTRIQQAAYHELHREPYEPAMAAGLLARVPADLEALTEAVVLRAAARFGFLVEAQSGRRTWAIELGYESLVDHLPGVPLGSRFLGTFDREEAVEDEARDFFASGHPLVEGTLAELEDGPRGRVALLEIPGDEELFGLLAIYRRGPDWEAVAVDAQGRGRPDLASRLTASGLSPAPVEARKWTAQAGWARVIGRLAAALPKDEEPQAVAAFRVRRKG